MSDKLIELLENCIEENVGVNDSNVSFEVDYENIADYLLANGVIVPPCKLDAKVWLIVKGFSSPMQATIREISFSKVGIKFIGSIVGYYGQTFMENDFGKTVFLTKKEAEAKLKEREG